MMNAKNFFVWVVVIYAAAFAVMTARGAATTNDYTYVPPGFTYLNPQWPGPTEWVSDSGAQSIRQLKEALLNWSVVDHYLDGKHRTNFLTGSMLGTNSIRYEHFASNVCNQLTMSNGWAQLPASDVWVQWVWWTNGTRTSATWNTTWPRAFSNSVWLAIPGVWISDTNFNMGGFSSNEWSQARVVGWDKTNVWGTINVSGLQTTQHTHKVCTIGVGR